MLQKLPPNLGILLCGFFFATFFFSLASFGPSVSQAGCGDYFTCNQEIEKVKNEISRLKGLENTLANQIAYLTNQIYLTELEIQAKGEEIKLLSNDIGDLSVRLERIASFLKYREEIFAARSRSAYISGRLSSLEVVLAADSLNEAMRRIKYLRVLEEQDREALEQMRETRKSFNGQKVVLEGKKADVERLKAEVEAQKIRLVGQRAAKDQLLQETRGEESRYQALLRTLEAERQAILEALRRGGTVIGEVSRGQKIANQGTTGCSTGPHIHYEVRRSSDFAIYNPCGYVGVVEGTCDSGYSPSYGGTVVDGSYTSPGGTSNYLTQSYWRGHLALDLVSTSGSVYASESGTAYLVRDDSWKSWCPYPGVVPGPAYGIYIVHSDGRRTVYWHIQP